MPQNSNLDDALEVGLMLGQRRAFALVAGKCSAASAEALRQIRTEKKYKALGLSWDNFCATRLGISRPTADKVIRQFEELGPTFFTLSQVTHITENEYRQIAGAVNGNALLHAGETIDISPENGPRLAAAIGDLQRSALAATEPVSDTDPDVTADRSFRKAERAVETALAEFNSLLTRELELAGRMRLQSAVGAALDRLRALQMSVRV